MRGYIRTWVTPEKLKMFGWRIKSELKGLSTKELTDAAEVLSILSGMVTDEMRRQQWEGMQRKVREQFNTRDV